jgi:Domain of unknown function (DUF1929)
MGLRELFMHVVTPLSKTLVGFIILAFFLAACENKTGPSGIDNPSAFNAMPGVTTIDLSWSTVSDATGYTLERQEGSGAFQQLLSNKNQTTYQDTNLTANTSYTYRLKAAKGSVLSSGVPKSIRTQAEGSAVNLSILTPSWMSKKPVNFTTVTAGQEISAVKNAATNVTVAGGNLLMTGNGEAMYYLGGLCTKFTASVTGSGTFRVVADDKEVWTGTSTTGDVNVVGKQNVSLIFQGTTITDSGTWTDPKVYCQTTPSTPNTDSPYVKGKWGPVFNWGDGQPRGTPGGPNYYQRGFIVPTHVASLPDGRIASWAAWREFTYGRKSGENPPFRDQTAGFVWNPSLGTGTNSFSVADNPNHDMFCAGLAMMADGRVFAAGGGSTNPGGAAAPSQYKASFFDFRNNTWTESRPGGANAFAVDHWYGSAVALPTTDNTAGNRLFVVGGSGGSNLPSSVEVRGSSETSSWTRLSGADNMFSPDDGDTDIGSSVVLAGTPVKTVEWNEVRGWYPFLHVAPNGNLFQSGPQPRLKEVSIGGSSVTVTSSIGLPASHAKMRTWGSSIMFDEGKILVSGGSVVRGAGAISTAMVLDINTDVKLQLTPDMRFRRAHHNAVVLPTGDVLVVGGNNSGKQFTDGSPLDSDGFLDNDPNQPSSNANYRWASDIWTETVFTPELYSPDKNSWRDLSDMKEPRNYHSVGILLQDGRVLAAGGGLCGDDPVDSSNPTGDDAKDCNHPNGEIFEPPYLFNPDGSTANRPTIGSLGAGASANPDVSGGYKLAYASTFNVTMAGLGDGSQITKFSMIKLSAVTHSMNTDVRYLEYSADKKNLSGSGNSYQLTTTGNKNVLTPGYYFLFAINDKGVPSVATVVQVN